jgi:protein involved in sex pheromone biosynthesis
MKKVILIVLMVLSFALAGCANNGQDQTEPGKQTEIQPGGQDGTEDTESKENVDTDVTQQIQSEKNVLSAKVSEQNDMILAAVIMTDETTAEQGQALAQKYMNALKTKYPGQRINIQVITAQSKDLATLDTQDTGNK